MNAFRAKWEAAEQDIVNSWEKAKRIKIWKPRKIIVKKQQQTKKVVFMKRILKC